MEIFRLDRILDWRPTGQYFTQARPDFNPNGDRSMSVVYDIANFNDNVPDTKTPATTEPRRKEEPVYIPPGENKLDKIWIIYNVKLINLFIKMNT